MTELENRWESLRSEPLFELRRAGRFLVAELKGGHNVISTSVRHGGWAEHLGWLVNHQSCEGTAHLDRHRVIAEAGMEAYHDRVCEEAGLPADRTAVMGTAANMNYVAIARECDDDVSVTAAVTAGVEGNATSAGEPATWRETDAGMQKVPVYAGTINTMLLINRPLTPAALARVVVTMTEGKTRRAAAAGCAEQAAHRSRHGHRNRSVLRRRARVREQGADLRQPPHEARRDDRVGNAKRDPRGAALAERPRGELHARRLPRARSIRRARGHAVRGYRAAS